MSDAHTWRRALRPSDAVVWALGASKDNASSFGELIVAVVGIPLLVWLFLLPRIPTVILLTLAAVGFGVWMTVTAHRKGRLGKWITPPVAAVATVLAGFLPVALLVGGPWPRAASLLAILSWEGFARITSNEPKSPGWWTHDRMANALVAAGVLRMVKEGDHERLPTLLYPGGDGKVNKTGRWVQIALPQAATLERVLAKHDELASEMGLDPQLLHIERKPGAPAGHITFAVLNPPSTEVVDLVVPEVWEAGEPIPVGHDRLGRPLEIVQRDCHSAWVGKTRSGKTWGARGEVVFPLQDPESPFWVVSGKDVAEDWQSMRDLCVQMEGPEDYAYASIRDGVVRIKQVLEHVERVALFRETIPRSERKFGYLVVDEWYRIRAAAKAYDIGRPREEKVEARLVQLMASLAATLAAMNIHIVFTSQRATDSFIGADLRANLTQKFCGVVMRDEETRLFLDEVPQAVPTQAGEFLYSYDDSEPTLFQMPRLTDEAFVEACEQARLIRLDRPMPALLPDGYQPEERDEFYDEVPEVEDDPLTLAVWAVLQRHGKAKTTTIYDELDPEARAMVSSAPTLGKALATMDGVRRCWGGDGNRTRMYELVPHPAGEPGSPRWLMARGELAPPLEQPTMLEDLGFNDDEAAA